MYLASIGCSILHPYKESQEMLVYEIIVTKIQLFLLSSVSHSLFF